MKIKKQSEMLHKKSHLNVTFESFYLDVGTELLTVGVFYSFSYRLLEKDRVRK